MRNKKCPDPRGNAICTNGQDTYHEWNMRNSTLGCTYCCQPVCKRCGVKKNCEEGRMCILRNITTNEHDFKETGASYGTEESEAWNNGYKEGWDLAKETWKKPPTHSHQHAWQFAGIVMDDVVHNSRSWVMGTGIPTFWVCHCGASKVVKEIKE